MNCGNMDKPRNMYIKVQNKFKKAKNVLTSFLRHSGP